ncbi:hypothetical protein BH10CHL1_BH10CHL1_29220 [soil metagenome]
MNAWHKLSAGEVVTSIGSDVGRGLDTPEAQHASPILCARRECF